MMAQLALLVSLCCGTIAEEKILINNILEARTEKCWTLDRLSRKDIVSCSATGVSFFAYARASQLNIISKETALQWIRTGFDEMLKANRGNDGWLYHFISTKGRPILDTEISSIDTVLFYMGAEKAARYLENDKLLQYILKCKREIILGSMMDSDGYFHHSFTRENNHYKLSKWAWTNYSEGVLIYKYFNKKFVPLSTDFTLPLFVFFYPLAFYPDERPWIDNLGKAIAYQKRITGRYGYSASDGPTTYVVNSPYVVSPLSVYSTSKFFPLQSKEQLKIYAVENLTPSMTINKEWISSDRILLDDGVCLMLISED